MTNCESNFPDQRGRRGDILVRYKGIDKRERGGGGGGCFSPVHRQFIRPVSVDPIHLSHHLGGRHELL